MVGWSADPLFGCPLAIPNPHPSDATKMRHEVQTLSLIFVIFRDAA